MGYELIKFFQGFSSPLLDTILIYFDYINSYYFYLIAIILLYIFWSKKFSLRLLLVCVITTIINLAFKYGLRLPPPSPNEITIISDSGKSLSPYGFPSLSVQLAITFWFYLSLKAKKSWLTTLSIIIVIFISISKLYLGAHFPFDLIGGALLGGLVIWVYQVLEKKIWRMNTNLPFP